MPVSKNLSGRKGKMSKTRGSLPQCNSREIFKDFAWPLIAVWAWVVTILRFLLFVRIQRAEYIVDLVSAKPYCIFSNFCAVLSCLSAGLSALNFWNTNTRPFREMRFILERALYELPVSSHFKQILTQRSAGGDLNKKAYVNRSFRVLWNLHFI